MRQPNKGSLAPENGHNFKHIIFNEIQRLNPGVVHITEDKTKRFWECLPCKGDLAMGGTELQVVNGRQWDVFYADPHAFPEGLLIEAKTQTSSGTAYEKVAYALLRASNAALKHEVQTAIVVGGPGFEKGAGLRVVQECEVWKHQFRLEAHIFPSLRDFSTWFGKKIRTSKVRAAE
jgi:hypothetical protein